ncbi:hypothetical protein PACTADRAFT_47555, partial [Pachysolen tannophilus NRRL Y-2460]
MINNKRILINFFKFLNTDSNEIILEILNVLDLKILKELNFKKTTKCKIFNEPVLIKLISLYGIPELREKVHEFLITLTTDDKYGIVFQDSNKIWSKTISSGISGSSISSSSTVTLDNGSGAPIKANEKVFKIHNKLIYTLLTNLKPWEDDLQQQLAIKVLRKSSELVAPLMNYLFQLHGSNEPRLSSFWIGQTLFLINVISTPIDENLYDRLSLLNTEEQADLDFSLIMESIVPSPITKTSLIKGFQSESLFIKQIVSQLVLHIFKKLDSILELLNFFHDNSTIVQIKAQIIDNLISKYLPDLSIMITTLSDLVKNNNKNTDKLLMLSLTMIIKHYLTTFPSLSMSNNFQIPNQIYINVLEDEKNLQSIDIILLDNYLQLYNDSTSSTNSIYKWWNFNGTSNSFFTSLIKLTVLNNFNSSSINNKIITLLENLTNSTIIFTSGKVLYSQILPLLHSLELSFNLITDDKERTKIWTLIDESISRCVRAPYKYLDKSRSVNDKEVISPFVVTLFEQWAFIENDKNIKIWLVLFIRYLSIIGEPIDDLIKLARESYDIKFIDRNDPLLDHNNYESKIAKINEGPFENDDSFFEYVLTTPLKKMLKNNKIPFNNWDLIGLVTRLKFIIQDDNLKYDSNVQEILIEMCSKLGNYLISLDDVTFFINNKKFWKDLFISDIEIVNEKLIYVSGLINEIFSQLKVNKDNEFSKHVMELLSLSGGNNITLPQSVELLIGSCLWCLQDADLRELLKISKIKILKPLILNVNIERNAKLSTNEIIELLSENNAALLAEIIDKQLVVDKNESLFSKILFDAFEFSISNDNYYPIIRAILKAKPNLLEPFIETLMEKDDLEQHKSLYIFVGSSISNSSSSSLVPKFLSKIINITIDDFCEFLNNTETQDLNNYIKDYLRLVNNSIEFLAKDEISRILNSLLGSSKIVTNASYIFSFEFVELISKNIGTDSNNVIRLWLNKAMLYVTKKFSESESLSSNFMNFLKSMKSIIFNLNVWNYIPSAVLNTQLEVILNSEWVCDENVLEYINLILLSAAEYKKMIEFSKLFQIFINNETNVLLGFPHLHYSRSRYYSSLIIWQLFEFDAAKNSSVATQEKVLLFYLGSLRAEDLILKEILIQLEANLSKSWIDRVNNWEFTEELSNDEIELIGESRLVVLDNVNGLMVNLSKKFLNNSIDDYHIENFKAPKIASNKMIGISKNWDYLNDFHEHMTIMLNFNKTGNRYQSTIYDPEFLIMLIISNDELVTKEDDHSLLHFKKILDSKLLQYIVMNLANINLNLIKIVKIVILNLLRSIEKNEKEYKVFKVYLNNLLNTLRESESTENSIPPLTLIMISRLIPILNNPGHFLYEKSCRYLLNSNKFKTNDLPLFKYIANPDDSAEENENYYKQINWLLDSTIKSLKTSKDLKILIKTGYIEWILNLSQSNYIAPNLRTLILQTLSKIQEIDGGVDLLIKSFGILANAEQNLQKFNAFKISNENKKRLTREKLLNEQSIIDYQKLMLRFKVCADNNKNENSKKRLMEWYNNDLDNCVKRIC